MGGWLRPRIVRIEVEALELEREMHEAARITGCTRLTPVQRRWNGAGLTPASDRRTTKVGIPNFVSGPGEYIMEGEYVILKITGLLYLY